MELRVIGRYGAYARAGGATSCYTVDGSTAADFGGGALSRLHGNGLAEIDTVLVSHMHSDHVGDLFTLRYYLADYNRKHREAEKTVDLYLPEEDCPAADELRRFPYYRIRAIKGGDTLTLKNGLRVELFDMCHAGLKTCGMVFGRGGATLGYTADTLECDGLKALLAASGTALCDCAVQEKDFTPESPHVSIRRMAELCKDFGTKMLVTHITTDDGKAALAEAKSICPDAELVQEGKRYSI
jgi:ribonuclease BN (tRNA processing enzyme)